MYLALYKISTYSSNDYIRSIKYYICEGVLIFREGKNYFCEGENKIREGEITAYYMDVFAMNEGIYPNLPNLHTLLQPTANFQWIREKWVAGVL